MMFYESLHIIRKWLRVYENKSTNGYNRKVWDLLPIFIRMRYIWPQVGEYDVGSLPEGITIASIWLVHFIRTDIPLPGDDACHAAGSDNCPDRLCNRGVVSAEDWWGLSPIR
uniref:Uncharacterized protein n=1 Tax=Solanum tuberosum TaxID=4113 RepID=M1DQL0_SOLTU